VWAYAFHQDKASSVRVPVANVTLSSSAHLLRENTDSFSTLDFITGATQTVSKKRPLKQSIAGKSKYAGRNSKGIVERIEYDPNRTSRIAVVRWEEKGNVDRKNNFDFAERTLLPRMLTSPTMPMKCQFNFSSLPRMTESRKVVSSGPKIGHVVVGLPKGVSPYSSKATNEGTKPTNVRDVFLSAFSSLDPWVHRGRFTFVSKLGVPRMALAGSIPDFFVPRYKDVVLDTERLASDDEVKNWLKDSVVWDHKMKRTTVVSWKSVRREMLLIKLNIYFLGSGYVLVNLDFYACKVCRTRVDLFSYGHDSDLNGSPVLLEI
ncbi:ribosomal protein L2, partial [Tanacetum coccineum]